MSWTYENLTMAHFPRLSYKVPRVDWNINVIPSIDGKPFDNSRWTRLDEVLPALENVYENELGSVRLDVMGGMTAALTRIEVVNSGSESHQFVVRCDSTNVGENPAWVDWQRFVGDNLTAGWNERADRLLILGLGADAYSLQEDGRAPAARSMVLVWNLEPGEKRQGWIVRPYRSYVADLPELRKIYGTAHADLLTALDSGSIRENDYRWIPGVPGKTCGSRWGALNAAFPCRLLAPDHELITGTLRKLETNMSTGGLPLHLGWQADGLWVAIALDNLAEVHLARGNGDRANEYLYATLNHGTPLYTWCEERGQEPGATNCTGDRQHSFTPLAVVRALRDMMVMENGDGLDLALGTARAWLASGEPVGVASAPTHFGKVTHQMQYDPASSTVSGDALLPRGARV